MNKQQADLIAIHFKAGALWAMELNAKPCDPNDSGNKIQESAKIHANALVSEEEIEKMAEDHASYGTDIVSEWAKRDYTKGFKKAMEQNWNDTCATHQAKVLF